jgi:hypothetical protein
MAELAVGMQRHVARLHGKEVVRRTYASTFFEQALTPYIVLRSISTTTTTEKY